MKTNQNRISTLSLKALEAKARRAATVAEVRTERQKPQKKERPVKRHRRKAIELEINSIYQALRNNASDKEVVILDRPGRDSSSIAKISIYLKVDLLRQKEEEEARRVAPAGNTADKPFRALPTVVYSLYAGTLNPDRLGSVAIYGDNPHSTLSRITKCGRLFGYSVKRASIEIGRRPFVDVTLAA